METMTMTPESKGMTTNSNLSEEVSDTNKKTISEWSKVLNKLIMEHNKQFKTSEAITLMKSGPSRITIYCEVCGSTGMVLDQQSTKPFKNLFNQHILRGRNHMYQYTREHGVEPQYMSKKEQDDESSPVKPVFTSDRHPHIAGSRCTGRRICGEFGWEPSIMHALQQEDHVQEAQDLEPAVQGW